MITIGRLAKQFHLSRSTLLYYDRIGLLTPSYRTSVGYRLYSDEDDTRLQTVCGYREAGLTLADIKELLASQKDTPGIRILENRLAEVQQQIIDKQLKFYVVDGYQVAREAGMGARINTVMQTCFFALSKILPRDEAIAKIKGAIKSGEFQKIYSKFFDESTVK